MKMKKIIRYLLINMSFFVSCQKTMKIHPIDELRNQTVLIQQNKDSSNFLYFEIENFKNIQPMLIAENILEYLRINHLEQKMHNKNGEVYCYFYQKRTFKNYKKLLSDQDQISDSGSLHEESRNLIVLVIYKTENHNTERNIIVYKPNSSSAQILYDNKKILK